MYTSLHTPSGALKDLLVGIPGRQERRLVHDVSAQMSFEKVTQRVAESWGIANASADEWEFAWSHSTTYSATLVVISCQDEWSHAFNNDFFRSSSSYITRPPVSLLFRKRAPPPTDAELRSHLPTQKSPIPDALPASADQRDSTARATPDLGSQPSILAQPVSSEQQQSPHTAQSSGLPATAAAPATQSGSAPHQHAAPQPPLEAVENLLRSVANLVGGAMQTDVMPLLDVMLNAAHSRGTSVQPARPSSGTLRCERATRHAAPATTDSAPSHAGTRRAMTLDELMARSRNMGESMGVAMGQAQARNAQRAGVAHAEEPAAQTQASEPSSSEINAKTPAPAVITPSPTPSDGGYEVVEGQEETRADVETTNASLSSAFDDMLAKMRDTHAESYQTYQSKGKAKEPTVQRPPAQQSEEAQSSCNTPSVASNTAQKHDQLWEAVVELLNRYNALEKTLKRANRGK